MIFFEHFLKHLLRNQSYIFTFPAELTKVFPDYTTTVPCSSKFSLSPSLKAGKPL
jgi:hypothetical protein